ncbi:TPA: phage head-tail connector protein [Staphylococcus aureus]|nr:phage head-tail connector protein [Staphylococcus aureus]
MQLTTTELKLLKMHCKIDHNSEDKLLETYYSWAFYEIVSAVTDDYIEYEDWFKSNPLFTRAVHPLANYYFENRIAYQDRNLSLAPHMVLSTVHKLRDSFERYLESEEDEI